MTLVVHGCGLAGSIVTQEGGDLSFVEFQAQPIDGQLVSVTVDLHKVLDVNTRFNVAGFLLNAHCYA